MVPAVIPPRVLRCNYHPAIIDHNCAFFKAQIEKAVKNRSESVKMKSTFSPWWNTVITSDSSAAIILPIMVVCVQSQWRPRA